MTPAAAAGCAAALATLIVGCSRAEQTPAAPADPPPVARPADPPATPAPATPPATHPPAAPPAKPAPADPPPTAAPADPPPTAAPAPCAVEDDGCRVDRLGDVTLGPLRAGLSREALIAAFGEPATRTKPEEEGASGEWLTLWTWPAAGVSVTLSAPTEDGVPTARDFTVEAPFAGKTDRGIGLGAEIAAVRAAYADTLDPRASPDTLIAGSVYGGVFFSTTAGRVTGIFVGAGAE